MTLLRAGLPALPRRMAHLPISEKGYPTPVFVATIDGKRDFRVVDLQHLARCIKYSVCWICGEHLGVWKAFVFGPLCAIQRVSNEPPSHLDCGQFAVAACPFLTLPKAQHRLEDIPNTAPLPGNSVMSNPGISAIWVTTDYGYQKYSDGIVFNVGDAERIEWYTEGRRAKRFEVLEAIRRELPKLQNFNAISGQGLNDVDEAVKTLIQSSQWL